MHHDDYLQQLAVEVMNAQATSCAITHNHHPMPLRFVWHHILPQVCGGQTVPENLVSLCDSCHYTVHILLWHLGQGTPAAQLPKHMQTQYTFALQGFTKAQQAGTVDKIPKESSL